MPEEYQALQWTGEQEYSVYLVVQLVENFASLISKINDVWYTYCCIIQAINVTSNNTASTLASLSTAINETEPADQLQVNFVVVVQVFSSVAAMALVQDALTVEEERQV